MASLTSFGLYARNSRRAILAAAAYLLLAISFDPIANAGDHNLLRQAALNAVDTTPAAVKGWNTADVEIVANDIEVFISYSSPRFLELARTYSPFVGFLALDQQTQRDMPLLAQRILNSLSVNNIATNPDASGARLHIDICAYLPPPDGTGDPFVLAHYRDGRFEEPLRRAACRQTD